MRHHRVLVQALAEVPLFATCSKRDLQIVARHMQVVAVPAGTALMREGDRGDAFYVVLKGEAIVESTGKAVAVLRPGDHVGELALLDPAPRNATVTSTADMTVGVIDARTFAAIVRDVPALTGKLLAALARRLRQRDREAAVR
ncbi:MAG: cyclic nucleotide-binding domain-containing protein [Candidatus Dormiibacterota bacterium]